MNASRVLGRARIAALAVAIVALVLGVWLVMRADFTVSAFADHLAPYRHAWYALPGVAVAFVALGLVMVPVLLLIAATGVAFGPWLGPLYAMVGSLASASTGFALGRWIGLERVEQLAGAHVVRVARALRRNGTLAVFLLRKIPLPFLLANVVAGASHVRYRDFLIGTVLGMAAVVVGLAGFGAQATRLLEDPTPRTVAIAGLALLIPLSVAVVINRTLRRRRPA